LINDRRNTARISCVTRHVARRAGCVRAGRTALACTLVVAVLFAFGQRRPAVAQSYSDSARTVTEAALKAAYLYNFARYFTWPKKTFEDPKTPFVIGVFGDRPLGSALDKVAKKRTAKGRKIVIQRFKSWKDYKPCQILFLPRTVTNEVHSQAIARTRTSPLLLVTETPGSAVRGAPVNFYLDVDGTIGFEINVDATSERKLAADARLLKLAKIVRAPPRPKPEE